MKSLYPLFSAVVGILLLSACEPEIPTSHTVRLENIGVQIDLNIPVRFDTTYRTVHFSDYDCKNYRGHTFANRSYQTIFDDTFNYIHHFDTTVPFQFDLIEFREDRLKRCTHQDFETYLERVKSIKSFHLESNHHERVNYIEQDDWNVLQIFTKRRLFDVNIAFMNAYFHIDSTIFELQLQHTECAMDSVYAETDRLFEGMRVSRINP